MNSIHRDTLWKYMEEFKIPKKLIKMFRACAQKTRSAVRIEGTLSSFFKNNTGLKQGDFLSTISFNLALQEAIQSIKMVPTGMKIGKEQLNVVAYADDIVLIGKNETGIRQRFVETENIAKKLGLHINKKNKTYDSGTEKQLKRNKVGHLTIKNHTFERVENLKYLDVIG